MLRWLFIFIFIFIHETAAQESLPTSNFEDLKKTKTLKVTAIIDPFTLNTQSGEIISLVGINIPDFQFRDPGPLSLAAITILKDMLIHQDVVLYQTTNAKTGRFNRMGQSRAHVMRKDDGAWMQGSLLRLGLARVETGYLNPEMIEDMLSLEAQAREEKIGLWADPAYAIKTPEDLEDLSDSFQIIEGKIISSAMKNNRVYLNFGQDWRTDFTVSIPPEHRRKFNRAELDPLSWNNQTIRVRGWLEEYNGPMIEITHPEMLEFVSEKN